MTTAFELTLGYRSGYLPNDIGLTGIEEFKFIIDTFHAVINDMEDEKLLEAWIAEIFGNDMKIIKQVDETWLKFSAAYFEGFHSISSSLTDIDDCRILLFASGGEAYRTVKEMLCVTVCVQVIKRCAMSGIHVNYNTT